MKTKKDLKIALCVIAKDKASIIERMLDSTQGVFDLYCLQDTGSSDETIKIFQDWCKRHGKKVAIGKGELGKPYKFVEVNGQKVLGDFAAARNDSFKLAKDADMDYVLWMDTDDVLENANGIREAAIILEKNNLDAAILTYDYAQTPEGIKIVTQKRERLIDLRKPGKWVNRVHENYVFDHSDPKFAQFENIKITHLRTPGEALQTGRRNNLIMTSQLQEDGIDNFPLKMLQDLAFDHWEYGEWNEAIKYYEIMLSKSPNLAPEYLADTFIRLAKAYLGLTRDDVAISYCYRALNALPENVVAFLLLAELFAKRGNLIEAEHFADRVLAGKLPNGLTPVNEMDFKINPLQIKLQANVANGKLREAIEISEHLIQLMPSNPQFVTLRRSLQSDLKRKNAILGVADIIKYLQHTNKMDFADRVIDAIPVGLLNDDTVRGLIAEAKYDFKRKTKKFKFEGKKKIIIFAGGHFEQWDGRSDQINGIGGSEGMCIQLSRELAKLGNEVEIYNECRESDGETIDGVKYIDWRKWSPRIACDVFISLRKPEIFSNLIKDAKKTYLWLHDTYYGEQDLSMFHSPNKVIVLSEFHKQVLKYSQGIEDDSIFWITRNGLNPNALKEVDNTHVETTFTKGKKNKIVVTEHLTAKRNPYKVIYASSYDRGLDNVLKSWPKIKQAVPKAELHIYYGWNTYDALMNARMGTPAGEYMKRNKEMLLGLMNQPGVFEHGRVTQSDLYKEFATSAAWYYPTQFEEISCITAMQAQALGAIPVCTPHAALKETVSSKYGFKVPLEKTPEALIHVLKNPEIMEKRRIQMIEWARKQFDMKELAKEWNEFFNKD